MDGRIDRRTDKAGYRVTQHVTEKNGGRKKILEMRNENRYNSFFSCTQSCLKVVYVSTLRCAYSESSAIVIVGTIYKIIHYHSLHQLRSRCSERLLPTVLLLGSPENSVAVFTHFVYHFITSLLHYHFILTFFQPFNHLASKTDQHDVWCPTFKSKAGETVCLSEDISS